ncbi:MAG: ABC transporter permease subunit [Candidatus Aegiribacteria sp.]|nr:ABC transporter permease subunit [Candidatus Aegiribacteria sp.]
MWIRELRETLRQTAFIMAFFILIPVLFLADQAIYQTGLTFIEYISNGLDLFILITAVYLAYNMFKAEEMDGATEYLLSLPITRWSLLRYKIIPRIAILMILILIGSIMNGLRVSDGSVLGMIFINWRVGMFYLIGFIIFIQISGFMLGLAGRESWSMRLMLLAMVLCVWQFGTVSLVINILVFKVFDTWTAVRFSCWLGANGRALLDFAVFYSLLWYILKPLCSIWDLKPMRTREIWFQKRAILPMLVFVLLFVQRLIAYPQFLYFW